MTGSGEEAVAVHEGMLEKEMEMAGKEKRRKKKWKKKSNERKYLYSCTYAYENPRGEREVKQLFVRKWSGAEGGWGKVEWQRRRGKGAFRGNKPYMLIIRIKEDEKMGIYIICIHIYTRIMRMKEWGGKEEEWEEALRGQGEGGRPWYLYSSKGIWPVASAETDKNEWMSYRMFFQHCDSSITLFSLLSLCLFLQRGDGVREFSHFTTVSSLCPLAPPIAPLMSSQHLSSVFPAIIMVVID